jgi:hypothetical protein
MPGNEFVRPKHVDHEIIDDRGSKVGDIRIKPSGVLWSRSGAHTWKRVNLEEFAAFMETNGKDQRK